MYLTLFLTFLEIGAVSFGGGYGMISLMREKVLMHGWLTEEEFLNVVAVSESTPGPIAINMATFIGSTQGGILGSFVATLGAILPSFIIIMIIAALVKNFLNYNGVKAFLMGIRPCVVGLIIATAFNMLLSILFSFKNIESTFTPDFVGIGIFVVLILIAVIAKKCFKKNINPILMIVIAGILGIITGYGEQLLK